MSTDIRIRLAEALDDLAAKERHVKELQAFVARQQETISDLSRLAVAARERAENREYEYNCTLQNVIRKIRSYSWILDGRGNYEWDDDDYRKEAGYAFGEVIAIAQDGIFLSHQLSLDFWKPLNQAQVLQAPTESTEFEEHWELHCHTKS
jgi:hypothetical protein